MQSLQSVQRHDHRHQRDDRGNDRERHPHGFCLGGVTERKAVEAAETMAEAGVALVTHGGGGLTMPPIEMLRAAGVLVFAGNDDIRDTWSPYGTGDLLERAAMIGWKGDFRRDDQVEVAFDLVHFGAQLRRAG